MSGSAAWRSLRKLARRFAENGRAPLDNPQLHRRIQLEVAKLSRHYPEIAGLTWGAEGAARLKALARERAAVDKKFRKEFAEQALEEDDRATRRWVKEEPPPGAPEKPQEGPVHPQQ